MATIGNILNTVQQRQLLAIQRTTRSLDVSQLRLATGKRVNSAIDDPQNFFAAKSLNNRASDLSRILDGIAQGIRTVQEANNGLTRKQAKEIFEGYARQHAKMRLLGIRHRQIANGITRKKRPARVVSPRRPK